VPSLAAIRFDPDGMSTFHSGLLQDGGHSPGDVQTMCGTKPESAVVYGVDGRKVDQAGFDAEHSPNNETEIGYAHVSVIPRGALERRARSDLAALMDVVHGSVTLDRPIGA
jgi:hypothetical protein